MLGCSKATELRAQALGYDNVLLDPNVSGLLYAKPKTFGYDNYSKPKVLLV